MSYDDFRKMLVLFGGGVILITSLFVFANFHSITEVGGQLLFLIVLVGATYYGREGGFITAILATVIYSSLFLPTIMSMGVVTILPLILVRAVIYLFTGVVGGEICSRVKQFLTEASHYEFIDSPTKLFNQKYFARLLRMQMENSKRYNTIFSLIHIKLSTKIMDYLSREEYQSTVKEIADGIVRNIRLVDEAGRIADDQFLILLPHTPEDGAKVCAKRVFEWLIKKLGEKDGADYEVLAFPTHQSKIEDLAKQLTTEK